MSYKLIASIVLALSPVLAMPQAADERVAELMNNEDWHSLRDFCDKHGGEVASPVLDATARFLTDYFSNRMDSAVWSGADLLNNYQSELGSSLHAVTTCYAAVLDNVGQPGMAADVMGQYADALVAAGCAEGDEYATAAYFRDYYSFCAELGGEMKFERPAEDAVVPFKGNGTIYLSGNIDGTATDLLFDTGAGVNVITEAQATRFDLRHTGIKGATVQGYGREETAIAFADSVRIGCMVFRDVPFHIVPVNTGHPKADSALVEMPPVVGIPFIRRMQEVRLDFADSTLTVPARLTPMPFEQGNVCLSTAGGLELRITSRGRLVDLTFDTGAAFATLNANYYTANRDYVDSVGIADSLRTAGVGGWRMSRTMVLPHFEYQVGGRTFMSDSVPVEIDHADPWLAQGLFGVKECAAAGEVTINLKEMFIDFTPLGQAVETDGRRVAAYDTSLAATQKPDADKVIGNLINSQDWLALDKALDEMGGDIKQDFLRLMAEAMTAYYLNRPDDALAAIDTLLTGHQDEMGTDNALNMALLMCGIKGQKGEYAAAADYAQSLKDQLSGQAGYEDMATAFGGMSDFYGSLKDLPAPTVERPLGDVTIPYEISRHHVRTTDERWRDKDFDLIYIPVEIGGKTRQFIFDTGAGSTFMSERFAREVGVRMLGVPVTINGGYDGAATGQIGTVDSLVVGGIVFRNPMITVAPPNALDSVAAIDAIIGVDFLRLLDEVRIYPEEKKIVFPATSTPLPPTGRNLMIDNNTLRLAATHDGGTMLFHFDTGNPSAGLYHSYYMLHQQQLNAAGTRRKSMSGSFNSVRESEVLVLPSFIIKIGGVPVELNDLEVDVTTQGLQTSGNDGSIGLDLVEQCDCVIVNFNEMYLKVEKQASQETRHQMSEASACNAS